MGKKKSDNVITGIIYLIGLPFIALFWVIKLVGNVILFFTPEKSHLQVGEDYSNASDLTLDVSKDMSKIQKMLKENYQDFITYPAIQQIEKTDRLQLMQYIWKHWDQRIDFDKLYAKYPQYSEEILNRIEKVESARCNMYYKKQEFFTNYIQTNTNILVRVYPIGSNGKQYYCLLSDMNDVFEYYIKDTEDYEFSHFPNYIAHCGYISEDKDIFFFANNKFTKMDKKNLLKLCKDIGIKNLS